ncbi:MAG: DNA repair protein RecN [Bacteroidales bacterium]|nr:DNA repair protein RecN [Bacteroidales bacterium]
MLTHLSVSNYALIESLELDFNRGFTAITGETGAGKSILVGALGLALGNRADLDVLLDKAQKCIVEAVFDISALFLADWFLQNELDFTEECIMRREISPAGKSRAFINDSQVNLAVMKELGEQLIDIHSQHESLHLGEATFQLRMIDSLAGTHGRRQTYHKLFSELQFTIAKLTKLHEQRQKSLAERDFMKFQFDELTQAKLSVEVYREMEQRIDVLNHAEEIAQALFASDQLLTGAESSVLVQVSEVMHELRKIRFYMPQLEELTQRLESCQIELKDITAEINHLEKSENYDPLELERLNQRIGLITHLMHKHRLNDIESLIALMHSFEEKLLEADSFDEQIERFEKQLTVLDKDVNRLADELSHARTAVLPNVEQQITQILQSLGMLSAQFRVQLEPLNKPGPDGKDKIRFLFTANRGSQPDDISRIASGGEMSRLMLAVKSLLSEERMLPTIIFDEIDSGISGEVAAKVGRIMASMAHNKQVISITHLPQIAGKAHFHLLVYKVEDQTTTRSFISQLDKNKRVEEIARMLSDEHPTDASLRAAAELMGQNE